jgi:hypothetical protein
MDPVPLIFSCDTEDYETPASDDAELLWARMFARHGLRACFCVVGEEARALRDRGRRDVLEALAGHEIASHSNMHSAHPTPAEYLEALSWEEGVRRFVEEEGRGTRDLREILGQQPSAWCKPGNSWGAVVPYGAAMLGMPLFCDAPFEWAPGRPMRYAGGLLLRYHTSFDRYFDVPGGERFERMRRDFEVLLDERHRDAEEGPPGGAAGGPLGGAAGAIVMYTHPCRTVTAAFPDNFSAGKATPRGAWAPAPLRPRAEVDDLLRDFDAFLRWIVELRASGRIVLTTYRELEEAYRLPPAPWVAAGDVVALARALAEDDAALEVRQVPAGRGAWLAPAEQLGLLVWALARRAGSGALPGWVPLRRLLGPLEAEGADAADGATVSVGEALAAADGATVSVGEVLTAAGAVSEACSLRQAVPRTARVGAVVLGPGRLLRLVARAVATLAAAGAGEAADAARLRVPLGGDAAALAGREDFAALRFRNTWSVFPPAFEGRHLIDQARWQAWSAAPA